jgi:hypothetical protein
MLKNINHYKKINKIKVNYKITINFNRYDVSKKRTIVFVIMYYTTYCVLKDC